MFYLHLKSREKSQSDMYCGTEGVIIMVVVIRILYMAYSGIGIWNKKSSSILYSPFIFNTQMIHIEDILGFRYQIFYLHAYFCNLHKFVQFCSREFRHLLERRTRKPYVNVRFRPCQQCGYCFLAADEWYLGF